MGKISLSTDDETIACVERYRHKHRLTMSRAVTDIIRAAGIDENGDITNFSGDKPKENSGNASDNWNKENSDSTVVAMMDILRVQIEVMKEQLKTKDEQLASKDQQMTDQLLAKDKQIEELHAQIEREQYLRANEQKALESREMKEKRGFLNWIRNLGNR